jgi:hypothetical protein
MIKRYDFISKYKNLNNEQYLKKLVNELEQYVDEQLLKAENIIKMINNDNLDFNYSTEITTIKLINTIHNDFVVNDNGSGRSGGTNGIKYAIWSSKITYQNGDPANINPIENKTLDFTVNGELIVYLPDNTNKNAAKMLVDKYIGPSDLNDLTIDEKQKYGFWGIIPQLDGTTTYSPDVVKLYWDSNIKRFKIVFKLNS